MKLLRLLVATCLADLVLSKLYVSPIVQYETIVWAPNVTFRDVTSYSNPIIGPTATGSIVAFSEAQTSSDNDVGKKFLAQSTSVDGGVSWTHQFDISDRFLRVDGIHLGEVLTDEETGTLFMVYSESAGTSGGEWKTYLINSTDGGKDWTTFADLSNISEPRQAAFHPGPGRGLQLKHEPYKGRLLFCGHANVTYDGVVCIYSDDHGYNWERGALLPGVPYGAEKIYRDFEPSQNQVGWTNKQTDRQWFIHP